MELKAFFNHYDLMIRFVSLLAASGAALLFYRLFVKTERLKRTWKELYKQMQVQHAVQKEEIEKQKREWGESFRMPAVEKVDKLLSYSGVQLKFPWLNGIIFIFSDLLLAAGVLVLALIVTRKLFPACIGGVISGLLPWFVLKIRSDMEYEATKRDFLIFLRMISSNAGTYQDILSLLDAAAQYVGNPIKGKVQMAVVKGRVDGNARAALEWLSDNMQYRLFKDLIGALEITSRHSLNYREINDGFMVIAEKKNISTQKQKVIIRKGRIGILVMLLLGIVMFCLVVITVNGNNNLLEGFQIFRENIIGLMILVYMGAVVSGALWYTFFHMRSE